MKSINLKYIKSRFAVFALAVLPAAMLAVASGNVLPDEAPTDLPDVDSVDMEQAVVDSLARLDSIAFARTAELVDKASEAYKNLKFIQYDGVTEAELYPVVEEVYADVLDAMDAPRITEADLKRFKGILIDVAPLLMKGSLYFSSVGDTAGMTRLATAYVDMRLDPEMQGVNFGSAGADIYPHLIYCAASGAYNSGNYEKAADYLDAYLDTSATDLREQVCIFLAQSCLNSGQPGRAVAKLISAVDAYPANFNLLMLTLQCCLDGGYNDLMQPLLDKALLIRPNDEQLLNAQGRLYENESNFSAAVDIFQRLYDLKPNSLSVNQHLALCFYNLGVDYYNKSLMESDEKISKRYMRQANAYLSSASDKLSAVVENDPSNVKYLKALAISYGCLGDKEHLDQTNVRLTALGVSPMVMNGMPESIVFADNPSASSGASVKAVPDFQEFARGYVERELANWTKRREFEKTEDYEKRVNQDNVYQEYQRLCKKAESDYLAKYAGRIRISDLELQPYDVDNESYLIESAMGPIVVKVPLKNKEAEAFKSSWSSIQLRNPKFYIKDNRVAIAYVELVTSAGRSYSYSSEKAADYDFTDVSLDVNSFLAQESNKRGRSNTSQGSSRSGRVIRAQSDVDRNIPVTSRRAEKTVALIMANEDYKNVSQVESALNDGETFSRYCVSTLGIPESQVMLLENLTYAEMLSAMQKLRQLVGALGDGVDVIVYYAGHGFPDEGSKDAYLLPVDGDGFTTAASFPLKKFYSDLSSMGADNVMVFLDACFSGAARDGGMLAEARGVALKPKQTAPEGSMFVLSAASDQETALPYKEKNHGMFTYFLLKKLQETKGNVTLSDLSAYVEENVRKNSISVNRKLQSPRASVSGRLSELWKSKKLRP